MRPYYEQSGVTIYHGDCREVLPNITADVLITDPPYGVDLGIGKDMRGGDHGLAKAKYLSYDDTLENFRAIVIPAIRLALSGVIRGAVFTGPHLQEFPKTETFGAVFCAAATGRHRWGFNTMIPIALYGTDPRLHTGGRSTVYNSHAVAESNGHPCPKPLEWMNWLVRWVSLEREIIVDPFAGSGTTLVAAKNNGRCAIGIEIEERYCEIAANRLAQEVLPLVASE